MSDYSKIKYNNTFLKQVIVRVDFVGFISNDLIFNNDLEAIILKNYSHKSKTQLIRLNTFDVTFDAVSTDLKNANNRINEGFKKEFYSLDNNKLFLTNKYIVFEINNYCSFIEHYKTISEILTCLYTSINEPILTERIGIRYINIFSPSEIKIRKNMFPAHISSMINNDSFMADKLIRNMNLSEYIIDNSKLNFRSGFYNSKYPSLPIDSSFTLDYDCYTSDQMDSSDEILRQIQFGHDVIQQMFESSITDVLRKVLNNE